MTLQQLHYAIVISETGSMNKAAEQLFISQPSLTSAGNPMLAKNRSRPSYASIP